MKKFFVSLVFLFVAIISLAGCDAGWVEVQSITYTTQSSSRSITLFTTIDWEVQYEEVEKTEYDNASDELKQEASFKSVLDVDRKSFIETTRTKIGKKFYYINYEYTGYPISPETTVRIYKSYIIKDYTIRYVKVKFLGDDDIELNYYDESQQNYVTMRVKTTSYEVTYFAN